jgi:hypothetical protein
MKIARIVLTATILLSLKSTLFSSVKEPASQIHGSDTTQTRRDSFDVARDNGLLTGFFGYNPDAAAAYVLDNPGKEYKGKEIRMGRGDWSQTFWNNFGKNKVNTTETAKKFLGGVAFSQINISEEALQPSKDLLAADKTKTIEEGELQCRQLNQSMLQLLEDRLIQGKTREAEIDNMKNRHKKELNTLKYFHEEEDKQVVTTGKALCATFIETKKNVLKKYPDAKITTPLAIFPDEFSLKNLPKLAEKKKKTSS